MLIDMLFFMPFLFVFNLMVIKFIIIQTNNCHNVFPVKIISQELFLFLFTFKMDIEDV